MNEQFKSLTVRLPHDLWYAARQAAIDYRIQGGLTEIIRTGLENQLAILRKVPLSFDAQFMRAYARSASWEERVASYGGVLPISKGFLERTSTMARDCFTLTELLEHFSSSTWTERTAQLVREQRQIWRERGLNTLRQPLFPPGWRPRIATDETATPGNPAESDMQKPPAPQEETTDNTGDDDEIM